MILSLRRKHRKIFVGLGIFLPLLFVAGIAARRSVPQIETLPAELASRTVTFTATEYERGDLFAKSPVQVSLWRELGSGHFAVGFKAEKDFLKPDLLVYWSATRPSSGEPLPPNANLLGAFVGGPLVLPTEASAREGYLILFSLANQEIVDISKSARFNGAIN